MSRRIALLLLGLVCVALGCQPPTSAYFINTNFPGYYLAAANAYYMVTSPVLYDITPVAGTSPQLYTITNNGWYLSSKLNGNGYNQDGAGYSYNQWQFNSIDDTQGYTIWNQYAQDTYGYPWLTAVSTPYGPYAPEMSQSAATWTLGGGTTPTPVPTVPPTPAPTAAPTPVPTHAPGCFAWDGSAIANGAHLQVYSPTISAWLNWGNLPIGTNPKGLWFQSTAATFTLNGVNAFSYGGVSGWQGYFTDANGVVYDSSYSGNFVTQNTGGGDNWYIAFVNAGLPNVNLYASQITASYAMILGLQSMNGQTMLGYLQPNTNFQLYVCYP